MAYKNKLDGIIFRSKTVLTIFVLSMIVFNCATAHSSEQLSKKSNSTRMLRSMARIYMAYGKYSDAQPLLEKALLLTEHKKVGDSERAMCLIDLAYLYQKQNELAKAEKMCKLGLILQQENLFENHPYTAYTWRNLGTIYQEQGNLSLAREAFDKAVTIIRRYHLEDDRTLAPFYVDIGKLLVAQEKFTEAEDLYLKALDLLNKNYGPKHLYTSKVSINLAQLYILQGKYLEAEPLVNKALAIQQNVYGSEHHFLIPALLINARINQTKGDLAASEDFLQRALAAVKKTGNITKIVELYQHAAKLRADTVSVYGQVAKANKKISSFTDIDK